MNSAKVKANRATGCFSGFGTFELTYPKSLYGVMEPNEFETTFRTLNSKCETKMPKSYLAFLVPILIGFILIIAGFVKFANSSTSVSGSASISASSSIGFSTSSISSTISSSSSSSSSFSSGFVSSSNPTNFPTDFPTPTPYYPWSMEHLIDDSMNINVEVKKSSAGPVLLGLGFTFLIVGCVGFGIAMYIFNNALTKKIKQELVSVNDHYATRRIKFTLETEVIEELVDPHEYDTHKGNKAYMNSISYDVHGRPVKRTMVYFILITFPAISSNQMNNNNSFNSNGPMQSFSASMNQNFV